MKKSILTLAFAAGFVATGSAGAVDLLYGLDFNGGTTEQRKANSSKATGSANNITLSGGFINWPEVTVDGAKKDVAALDGTRALKTSGGVPVIGNGSASIGADTVTGFTISVNVTNTNLGNDNGYKDILGFTIGGTNFKFEYNGNKSVATYGQGNNNNLAIASTVKKEMVASEWYNVVLSVTATGSNIWVIDSNGLVRALGSTTSHPYATDTTTPAYLTKIETAKNVYDNRHVPDAIFLDNIAVYDAALTLDQAVTMTLQEVALGTVASGAEIDTVFSTNVLDGYYNGDANRLFLYVGKDLTAYAQSGVKLGLNVLMSDPAWAAIVAQMGDMADQEVYVTLTDDPDFQNNPIVSMSGDEEYHYIDLGTYGGAVTFNGYEGEGAGKYKAINMPEPTTTTLSLLALAGLAVRRRRK